MATMLRSKTFNYWLCMQWCLIEMYHVTKARTATLYCKLVITAMSSELIPKPLVSDSFPPDF